ncbi:PREDICTED: probable imidazolonepropionase [Amphimedon queenslandica]|uniref:Probable imidazolonepropionase n=1 Tax=Amphimedon queenslandica TaxID=400682 RepID=A0A1X7VQR6_AMPQE|nr:PREDICTED: probable imidazolonepropionase [Amphimedon queenslandica]|eukprot:XP_019855779.1 PREDICTED: probable imidazolonepropionase [Amphimedon queenslandica]
MAGLLRVRGASQVVQVCREGEKVLRGASMKDIAVIQGENGRGVGLVVDGNGLIADLGFDDVLDAKYSDWSFKETVLANGSSVLPGFVDAHTHPVWVGDRVNEFAMKLAGATYMDIHKSGGGINFTVQCVRSATHKELYDPLVQRLWSMMRCGTTTVEAKSGYGLETESEVKMLEVLNNARQEHPMDLSITYCGAHAVPRGLSSDEATLSIIEEQIPTISDLSSKGQIHVDNIDVFCEKGVFDLEQSRRILAAGKREGWRINFHGDELHPMGSGELAGELEAAAVSHLEEISDAGIAAMSQCGSIGVLLPTTAYMLRLRQPPARKMIEKGMAIALGSDFNPNAYCYSMPLVMHLACVNLRLSMEESLVAATINAAAALGLSDVCGSIEVGKKADLVILSAPKWENIIYQFGCHRDCIQHVIKEGNIVYSTKEEAIDVS